MWDSNDNYDVRDGARGVVRDTCWKGLILALENGQEAFATGSRSPGPAGCAGSPAAVLPCKGPWAASPAQCSHSLQKILHIVPHLPRFFKTAPANSGNLPLFSAF